ncbi:uncharacterized protein LOC131947170 [Physella acuta]|uniref:uncharacterized protein LOC131947170 n=1 Tax=Physella acuta TaxID=109671 RepID=UPI0027DB8BD4|nr:uncharacterized protein LOC131947170 [Physella acuta]
MSGFIASQDLSPECGGTSNSATVKSSNDNLRSDEASEYLDPKVEKKDSEPNTDGHFIFKYQTSGDIRQQLLVQRTFTTNDEHPEPRTKVRVCTNATGTPTVTVSPSSGSMRLNGPNLDGGDTNANSNRSQTCTVPSFISPSSHGYYERLGLTSHDMQTIFKTPNRNQRLNDEASGITPSRCGTPLLHSPASTASYGFTPGRQFINPFEVDHDRLHMPIFSPNMFKAVNAGAQPKKKEEGFWSLEHAALIMPAEIKEAEFQRQHRYQQKIDREQDARVQSAINKFFSNEVIVPSPWSEKVTHILPRTPGSVRSVSCQTSMSVSPNVDLISELEGKYLLPEYKTDSSPSVESIGNSFIRRKLLHQLNSNDSDLFTSPVLPSRPMEEVSSSPSPVKQTTPEWEKQTPNTGGSGHFSSSPIRYTSGDRGYALSESDLLASPELSPITSRTGRSMRSSGIYHPNCDTENARTVMQLDFSSILNDPDDDPEDITDKTGTVIQRGLSVNQQSETSTLNNDALSRSFDPHLVISCASQDSDGRVGSHQSLLALATSAESMTTSVPHCSASQDTGYQTASLQSTNHESGSYSSLDNAATHFVPEAKLATMECNVSPFAGIGKDHPQTVNAYSSEICLNDGSFLAYSHPSREKLYASEVLVGRKGIPCRSRKVRTMIDVRTSKEKSTVSRDLTHSFNEETEKFDFASGPTHETSGDIVMDREDLNFPPFSLEVDINNKKTEVQEILDASMRSSSPNFSATSKKVPSMRSDTLSPSLFDRPLYSRNTVFSESPSGKNSDDTLLVARELLGKSEQFRMMLTHRSTQDSFFVEAHDTENQDPMLQSVGGESSACCNRSKTPPFRIDPVDSSTPTTKMLNSLKEKIENVQGEKLGSEIAAEILKRAGDDLAILSGILGKKS